MAKEICTMDDVMSPREIYIEKVLNEMYRIRESAINCDSYLNLTNKNTRGDLIDLMV